MSVCGRPHGQSCCILQEGHEGGCEHSEQVLAARREGVIQGLERALRIIDADRTREARLIAAEIERIRGAE